MEAGKSDGTLDDTEDRFDSLFAFSVAGFAVFAFEFRLHCQADCLRMGDRWVVFLG
jgi:hypothetical protein